MKTLLFSAVAGLAAANGNNWEHGNKWASNNWEHGNKWASNNWEHGNKWANNNWEQPNKWVSNNWDNGNKWDQSNSWSGSWANTYKPHYSYGFEHVYAYECNQQEGGKYYCMDDGYGKKCGYYKTCESDHPRAKPMKRYHKKVYFDRKFEEECKSPQYWSQWWHGRLLSSDSATTATGGAAQMRGMAAGGLRRELTGYDGEHCDYGWEHAYVKEGRRGECNYHCLRNDGDNHDGLCNFKYVQDCHSGEHGCAPTKRYYKVVFYDKDLEEECRRPDFDSWCKQERKHEEDTWRQPAPKQEWQPTPAPKQEWQPTPAPKQEWHAPRKPEGWTREDDQHEQDSWTAPTPKPVKGWTPM